MTKLDLTDSHTGVARGSGKPQAGEPVAHPGRGGRNLYIDDAPSSNHPRGSGMAGQDEDNELSSGSARGSGKPQAGESVAHPGRGGQNLFISDRPGNDKSAVNHPRGSGMYEQVESGSLTSSYARGGGKSQEGEAVSHPGRGGQNMYINDMPSPNHPRGSGASQGATPAQSTQEPQSLNDSGLTKLQMTLIAERMNEVMQNNVLQNQPSMES